MGRGALPGLIFSILELFRLVCLRASADIAKILSVCVEKLLADVRAKSDYIVSELSAADGVKSVSGMGLMLGVETVRPAREVVERGIERGVLTLTAKAKVRLLPPLTITMDELKQAVALLKDALKPE